MNIIYKNIRFILMLSILHLTTTQCLAGEQSIRRDIYKFELGMTIKEAKAISQLVQKEDTEVYLMQKYGFGNPDKQKQINDLLGKQVFSVMDNLPENAESMEILFRKGMLYQIAMHYGKNYVMRIDWDIFTVSALQKYGQPLIRNNLDRLGSFSYYWNDGKTTLEISKIGSTSSTWRTRRTGRRSSRRSSRSSSATGRRPTSSRSRRSASSR